MQSGLHTYIHTYMIVFLRKLKSILMRMMREKDLLRNPPRMPCYSGARERLMDTSKYPKFYNREGKDTYIHKNMSTVQSKH